MAVSARKRRPRPYDQNVFINCPFDDEYTPLFEAIVFTIFICGFRPVCARERLNSAEVRLEKLVDLIRTAKFSIHDLSRTSPDKHSGNPRFNMPFELGLDLGCGRFNRKLSDKCALIFAAEKYEYQKFLSDIAGQDIENHHGESSKVISGVRGFLAPHCDDPPPGTAKIRSLYVRFRKQLPGIVRTVGLRPKEMGFTDLTWAIRQWMDTLA